MLTVALSGMGGMNSLVVTSDTERCLLSQRLQRFLPTSWFGEFSVDQDAAGFVGTAIFISTH